MAKPSPLRAVQNKLHTKQCDAAKPKAKEYPLPDGSGLRLLVTPAGNKIWRYKYRYDGKEQQASFGPYPEVPLFAARRKRDEYRAALAEGRNPKGDTTTRARGKTFGELTHEVLANAEAEGKALNTLKAKRRYLQIVAAPLTDKPITIITHEDVHAVLAAETAKGNHAQARRVLIAMGEVFERAQALRLIKEDPSQGLERTLPVVPAENHAAVIDTKRLGELLIAIDMKGKFSARVRRAMQLTAHLFVRPDELRGMRWEHVTLTGETPEWRIPATSKKERRPHVVPLSKQALNVLVDQFGFPPGDLVFADHAGTPISENTINKNLRSLGFPDQTAHGFRTTASTLLRELGYDGDLVERQLAHKVGNTVQQAYDRAERLTERRAMMQRWSDYLDELKQAAREGRGLWLPSSATAPA